VSRGHALACADCRELLGGYVLSALEPDEMSAVRAHLTTCAECAREHAQLAPVPALLDAAGSADAVAEKPPPALEDAVLHRFARERHEGPAAPERGLAARPAADPAAVAGGRRVADPAAVAGRPPGSTRADRPVRPRRLRSWLARPLPVALAAAAAAALVTLALSGALSGDDGSTDHSYYGASLRGSPAAPSARAYAKLAKQPAGTRVELHVRDMRPERGAVYELWCIGEDGTRMSAGTFRVDSTGRANVRLTTAARIGEYHRLAVERRTAGRAGERVLAGVIDY
jgi:hypothetical protein